MISGSLYLYLYAKSTSSIFFYTACSFKIILAFLFLDHVTTRLFVPLILRSEDKILLKLNFSQNQFHILKVQRYNVFSGLVDECGYM